MSRLACRLAVLSAAMVAAGAARADTMPQLEFGNRLLLSQVVWGAIIFAGFYVLLARWGLPQVASVLEFRAKTIGAELDQARVSKAEADQAVAQLNSARSKAYAESQAAIAEATRIAKAEAEARAAEQASRLDAQLAQSERRIADSRAQAMGRLAGIATETAEAIIARLTGHTPDPAGSQAPWIAPWRNGRKERAYAARSRILGSRLLRDLLRPVRGRLWKALAGMLDGRASAIRAELGEAQRLRQEAEVMLARRSGHARRQSPRRGTCWPAATRKPAA